MYKIFLHMHTRRGAHRLVQRAAQDMIHVTHAHTHIYTHTHACIQQYAPACATDLRPLDALGFTAGSSGTGSAARVRMLVSVRGDRNVHAYVQQYWCIELSCYLDSGRLSCVCLCGYMISIHIHILSYKGRMHHAWHQVPEAMSPRPRQPAAAALIAFDTSKICHSWLSRKYEEYMHS